REPVPDKTRSGKSPRFWLGEGYDGTVTTITNGGGDVADNGCGSGSSHQPRKHIGDGRLHVSGTSPGRRVGRAHRPVFFWGGSLRDGDRAATVHRQYIRDYLRCHSE